MDFKKFLEEFLPLIPINQNQINYGIRSKISVPNEDLFRNKDRISVDKLFLKNKPKNKTK